MKANNWDDLTSYDQLRMMEEESLLYTDEDDVEEKETSYTETKVYSSKKNKKKKKKKYGDDIIPNMNKLFGYDADDPFIRMSHNTTDTEEDEEDYQDEVNLDELTSVRSTKEDESNKSALTQVMDSLDSKVSVTINKEFERVEIGDKYTKAYCLTNEDGLVSINDDEMMNIVQDYSEIYSEQVSSISMDDIWNFVFTDIIHFIIVTRHPYVIFTKQEFVDRFKYIEDVSVIDYFFVENNEYIYCYNAEGLVESLMDVYDDEDDDVVYDRNTLMMLITLAYNANNISVVFRADDNDYLSKIIADTSSNKDDFIKSVMNHPQTKVGKTEITEDKLFDIFCVSDYHMVTITALNLVQKLREFEVDDLEIETENAEESDDELSMNTITQSIEKGEYFKFSKDYKSPLQPVLADAIQSLKEARTEQAKAEGSNYVKWQTIIDELDDKIVMLKVADSCLHATASLTMDMSPSNSKFITKYMICCRKYIKDKYPSLYDEYMEYVCQDMSEDELPKPQDSNIESEEVSDVSDDEIEAALDDVDIPAENEIKKTVESNESGNALKRVMNDIINDKKPDTKNNSDNQWKIPTVRKQ